jgi:hypothetical protein
MGCPFLECDLHAMLYKQMCSLFEIRHLIAPPPRLFQPDMSSNDVALIIAVNFALCTSPDSVDIDWTRVPIYSNEKEHETVPWCAKEPFNSIFLKISPPPADVQKYCSALLLPLLRSSTCIGSELLANKIENHSVKGEILDPNLLPSVITALGEAHRMTAVDVALMLAKHVLPLVPGAASKLYVRRYV